MIPNLQGSNMSLNNEAYSKQCSKLYNCSDSDSDGYNADTENDSEIEEDEVYDQNSSLWKQFKKRQMEMPSDSDSMVSDSDSMDVQVGDWEYDRAQMELHSDSDTESIDSMDTQVGSWEEEDRHNTKDMKTGECRQQLRPRLHRQNAIYNPYKCGDDTTQPWLKQKTVTQHPFKHCNEHSEKYTQVSDLEEEELGHNTEDMKTTQPWLRLKTRFDD